MHFIINKETKFVVYVFKDESEAFMALMLAEALSPGTFCILSIDNPSMFDTVTSSKEIKDNG